MFVYTLKASTIKFFGVVLLSVVVLIALVAAIPDYNTGEVAAVAINYDDIKTNENRVEFLESFGYTIKTEPSEVVEVVIPDEFNSIYETYNNIQKSQGLNLKKYQGKKITRYTYEVENYGYDGRVLANLLIYKNKVIGGDVCSLDGEGFIHGFENPQK
ncbi:MAG: hypothetical protein A2Y17_02670 [Clostridiales bacterium GWF2_38_85]|nr:MAG: hypothetical protein A2Y17_02670 [Clostridiales bacterium GWF2_38_85]